MTTATDSVNIRAAREGDADALAPLVTHLGYPSTPEQMRARMARIAADPDFHTFVAERDGRVVGMAGVRRAWSYNFDEPAVRVASLVVEADEQGRGTGAALMAAVEAWARTQGAAAVTLTTALHRDGAHRFYRRIGYAQTGLRFARRLG